MRREDLDNPHVIPDGIPVPVDDGLCDHLAGAMLPPLALPSTSGREVVLAELGRAVLFFYPRTGVPLEPALDDWNFIPGARGCTPQSCGFRDLHGEFARMGVAVYGVSTQATACAWRIASTSAAVWSAGSPTSAMVLPARVSTSGLAGYFTRPS